VVIDFIEYLSAMSRPCRAYLVHLPANVTANHSGM
jgi:hypothetical protein